MPTRCVKTRVRAVAFAYPTAAAISFKDVISLGVSFYLISYFGNKAILLESSGE